MLELAECIRAPQVTSDHKVPIKANAVKATGKAQAGRLSISRKCGIFSIGIRAKSQSTIKMAGSEVENGSETATNIAKTSADVCHRSTSRHFAGTQRDNIM